MKKIIGLLFLTLSFMAMANKEQCLIKGASDVSLIELPEDSQNYVYLTGFDLPCDNSENHWCRFNISVNESKTTYNFEDDAVLNVVRDSKGKLKGPGTYKSKQYTNGKTVKAKCLKVKLSRR